MQRVCEACGGTFETLPSVVRRGKARFCSKRCATKGRWGNRTFEERFWSKVDRRSADECWPWKGGSQRGGYGSFQTGTRAMLAHRVAWELTNGLIPDALFACHRCDNPPCCNPAHLFLGTNTDNMRDMHAKHRDISHTKPERHARGERQHLAKLTEAQVIEIRARYTGRRGEQRALAREYGVTFSAICELVNGRTWKHV